jgi:protoporphyrin/coproporphyrin ferrochelatase
VVSVAFFEEQTASRDVTTAPPTFTAPPATKLGVALLNLGGPESLDDVEPFLYNLFADPEILRLPPYAKWLQPFIARFISASRAPKSKEGYQAIGGRSPLRGITEDQAAALGAALKDKGQDAHVYVAMRYWRPFTEEVIEKVICSGPSSQAPALHCKQPLFCLACGSCKRPWSQACASAQHW